jgi:hypothetical protein
MSHDEPSDVPPKISQLRPIIRSLPLITRSVARLLETSDGDRPWFEFSLELTSLEGVNLSKWIQSVTFELHTSFGKTNNEVLRAAPYRITRRCWAESIVRLVVRFHGCGRTLPMEHLIRLHHRSQIPATPSAHTLETPPPPLLGERFKLPAQLGDVVESETFFYAKLFEGTTELRNSDSNIPLPTAVTTSYANRDALLGLRGVGGSTQLLDAYVRSLLEEHVQLCQELRSAIEAVDDTVANASRRLQQQR